MGNSNSSTINNLVDVVNTVTTDIVNRSVTSGNASSLNIQTFLLDLQGDVKCSVDINQSISSDQKLSVSSVFNSASEVQNTLDTMVDQIAESNQKAVADFLALAVNNNESKQSLTSSIKNDIKTKVTNENITNCQAFVQNLQKGKFYVPPTGKLDCGKKADGTYGDIKINQSIVNKQIAECLSQTFFNTIASNDIVNKISQAAETDQSGETKGPFAWLESLGKTGIIVAGVIGGIILLIIVVVLLSWLFGGSQKNGSKPQTQQPALPK